MRRGIIDGYCRVADAFAIDHQLEFRVLHTAPQKAGSILRLSAESVLEAKRASKRLKNKCLFMIYVY